MKTPEQLEAMTRREIDRYAAEVFGAELDARASKGDMIAEVLRLQEKTGDTEPEAEQNAKSEAQIPDNAEQHASSTSTETVRVTVTDFAHSSGVPLIVNGKRFDLPIGKPVEVPAHVIGALKAAGVPFTKE